MLSAAKEQFHTLSVYNAHTGLIESYMIRQDLPL